MSTWTAPPEEARKLKLYPGEYVAVVAFVRNYGDDCACLDATGQYDGDTPHRLAQMLNAEIQEAADNGGQPVGRWQVLALGAPE